MAALSGEELIAKIAVSAAVYQIDRPYSYSIPANLAKGAVPGMRVIVPFGAGNRKSEGVILSLAPDAGKRSLKTIGSLLDDAPVLDEESIKLALWMSDRFFCTVFDALRAMLPAGMWIKEGTRQLHDKTTSFAVLNILSEEALDLAIDRRMKAPKQAAVLTLLAGAGEMPLREIYSITGASSAPVKELEKQGFISIEQRVVLRRPDVIKNSELRPFVLNEQQTAAFTALIEPLKSENPEAALLYGVTGSGKTLVYIKLIEKTLSLGKTAIVLVPEISLTPQVASVFSSHFGDRVAVLHSALGSGERYDEWKRIRSGLVRVVIGTRSAVFAPLKDIGLIVLDEEQEHTYKSESSPRYHAGTSRSTA